MLAYGLGVARPLWVDEEMILLNVRDRPWSQIAGPLWLDQSAPLGWFVLERGMVLVFGEGERAARFLPVAFGAATLIAALWIGLRWMTPLGAIVLAAMCATGEWLVFFTLELKHYSSDAFWALLLPALAAWVIDPHDRPDDIGGRARTWWLFAAIGQWLGNGALFVTPALGLLICGFCWRYAGWRGVRTAALGVAVWLVSFAINFVATLHPALANVYLANYWSFAYPPARDGMATTLRWLLNEFRLRAIKPGGTQLWWTFWLTWAAGITYAIARRRTFGWTYATVPASALVLAFLHIVPTFERLALWFVPSLYVGVAICADAFVDAIRARSSTGIIARAAALIAGIAAVAVSANVAYRGIRTYSERPQTNYGLDDRSSIRYLLAAHHSGDPILTTHYGTAALWWYGHVDLSGPEQGTRLTDGSPVYEVKYPDQTECRMWDAELARTLAGHTRADVYLGFRANVEPDNFADLVLSELSKRGQMVGYKEYGREGQIATFDFTRVTTHQKIVPGCISIRRARRW